jgi:hypothetical protein
MQHKQDKGKKDLYEKPKLRIIELSAEEVLGVGCKTGRFDSKGIAGNGCTTGPCSSRTGS